MTIDISVVIPVYNGEGYLKKCLDSVVGQTYRRLEILCVDDGSTDGTWNILEDYSRRDSRIRPFRQANAGVSAARNHGIDAASGEYVLFIDSDDSIDDTLCEKTLSLARQNNVDLVWFFNDRKLRFEKQVGDRLIEDLDFSERLYDVYVWTKLWRAEFLRRHRLRFSTTITSAEDTIFHWQAMAAEPRIASLKERLYHYAFNERSLTNDVGCGYFRQMPQAFDRIREILTEAEKYQGRWKEVFLATKLKATANAYGNIAPEFKREMLDAIRKSHGEDERAFLKTSRLPTFARSFYHALDGSRLAAIQYDSLLTVRKIEQFVSRQLRKYRSRIR